MVCPGITQNIRLNPALQHLGRHTQSFCTCMASRINSHQRFPLINHTTKQSPQTKLIRVNYLCLKFKSIALCQVSALLFSVLVIKNKIFVYFPFVGFLINRFVFSRVVMEITSGLAGEFITMALLISCCYFIQ